MARAAAKRNKGAGKAARPVGEDQRAARRKAEKSLEDELFFNRLRGHAKWVFVLLAVVFGASFVFLGVGSGNAGLSDVFSNVFGGSSGPSIGKLQAKVAETPRDKVAVSDLAQALQTEGRTDEAIAVYRAYLDAKPKDVEILNSLAALYQSRASTAADAANRAIREASLAAPETQFRPGTGALGQALGSYTNPITQLAATEAEARYREAVASYQSANRDVLDVYKRLVALQPDEPTALFQYAQVAEAAGDLKVAISAYGLFLKRFPEDSFTADVKKKVVELKQQLAEQESSVKLPNVTG